LFYFILFLRLKLGLVGDWFGLVGDWFGLVWFVEFNTSTIQVVFVGSKPRPQ